MNIKLIAIPALALAAGIGLAACGGGSSTSAPAAAPKPAVTRSAPAAAAPSSPSLMSTAQALATKAGCPNPADIATNAGNAPGSPEVGFTCNVSGTSAFVDVFESHTDEQANLAYRDANVGGTLVTGPNFIANIYNNDPQTWDRLLGGTTH